MVNQERPYLAPEHAAPAPWLSAGWRVFLLSGLILFLELSLIRWTGAYIVHLSYFTNFILLGSFLGIGLGFLLRQRRSLLLLTPYILVVFVAVIHFFPVQINRQSSSLIFFTSVNDSLTGLPIWVTLPIIFICTALVFTTLAQTLAQAFAKLPPLTAYRLDLLGSIVGIVVFSSIAWLGWPPVVWGLIVGLGLFVIAARSQRWLMLVPILGTIVFLGLDSLAPSTAWSPYYRITTQASSIASDMPLYLVNGIPHQQISPIARLTDTDSFYFLPYERFGSTPPPDVLVVGAGTGTDVAMALHQGASRVDAVEIDPVLARLGRQENPDHPYDDPRVHLYINDGRSFLEQTNRTYDLIIFALPDSLTLVAGQASLRLESYMFTREAMSAVKRHLKPTGQFSMYNYYREPWLVDRLYVTLNEVFQQAPCVDSIRQSNNFAVLSVSQSEQAITCPAAWTVTSPAITPVTDTHPFLYLRQPSIPSIYLLAIGCILLVSCIGVRSLGGTWGRLSPYADLFFMGMAFMLLETKNVVHFALLFGTTWFVNALVFSGILLIVLLTVTVARKLTITTYWPWYLALVLSLGLAWLIPSAWLLSFSPIPRFFIAVAAAFLPIFIANCIFAARLRASESSTDAFAANLIGAMVGGVLEYSSLVIGYQQLLFVVAALYIAALVMMPKRSRSTIMPT